jgi:hypothetical protein
VRIDPEDPARALDDVRPRQATRPARPEGPPGSPGEVRGEPGDGLSLSASAREFGRLLERLRALPEPGGPARAARLEVLRRGPVAVDSRAIAAALLRDEAVAAFLGFPPDP